MKKEMEDAFEQTFKKNEKTELQKELRALKRFQNSIEHYIAMVSMARKLKHDGKDASEIIL